MIGEGEVKDTPLEIKDKTLFFRGKPVVTLEGGYSFFFMEKDGIDYWLNQVMDPAGEITTQWVKHREDTDPEFIGRRYVTLKGLEDTHKTRDNHLIDKITKEGIGKDEVNTFFDEVGPFIQHNNLNKPPGDPGPGGDLETPPESFQEYPENIQRGALKIIEDPQIDVFQFLKGTISKVHIGDDPEIEFSILKEFSLHVENGETVHDRIMGGEDTGKTDLSLKVLDIVPTRWQLKLTSLSPKYLYYSKKLREDYNHIVINDFLDNPDSLGLIKVMTDNLQDRKEHHTVIDGTAVDMEIPGKITVTITAKKDINDPETERRFLHLNPQEDPDHKRRVKEFIKRAGITGSLDSSLRFELCRAIVDKLTEAPLKVFNPWIECLQVEDLGNTDIKIFIGLVKARALIYQEDREKIGNDTILGTRGDVEGVLKLWFKIAPLQQFKISKQQLELLNELPVYEEGIYKEALRDRDDGNSLEEGTTGRTYKDLSTTLKKPVSTIRTWIKGYSNKNTGQEKPGLESLGFIISKSSNPGKEKAPLLFYLNPEKKDYLGGLKEEKTYLNNVESKINDIIIGLNSEKEVISQYLLYLNKSKIIIRDIYKNSNFEKPPSIVKTDKEVYNIICSTREALKTVEVEEIDPIDYICNSLSGEKIKIPPGTMEEPLNEETPRKPIINNELNMIKIGENGKERPKDEKLLLVNNLLQYIKENPNTLEDLTLELSNIIGPDEDPKKKAKREDHIRKILTKLVKGGKLRDPGTGILEVVGD